ncbi:hypothetical protein HWC99_gp24 [Flavobacterium phage vB_FspS_tant8-1]|uniref:Uncharacterized protein n=1 Tax=Flavobacterium phage vB_FspS_tant8-1 TaxID=2686278 RepID=A0A6B9LRR2_9CAUD|nr:hypothetical protein HWC99_gp24 [Flavobacterium phage vB_FspS_tant8-1]QHB40955.1 hypothetical protein tant81_gp024 [Flavobacterium phage vB_FspS_tant8-1]
MKILNERTKRQIKRLQKIKEINNWLTENQIKNIDQQIENLKTK